MQVMVLIYHDFLNVSAISLGVLMVMVIIGVPIFWRFDRMFKHRPNIMDFGIPLLSIQGRILSYMFAIVRKNRSTEHPFFKYTFQGYDFQENTNLFEKIYCHTCIWNGYLMLLTSCLWAIIGAIIYLQTGAWPQ